MADEVSDSILNSVKKVCGVDPSYEAFDVDFLMYINSCFADLNQLGVGPEEGFFIEDETQLWSEYLEDDFLLNNVKTYVNLKVRQMFDPPETGHHVTMMSEQIKQHEFRINMRAEEVKNANA